MFERIAQKSGRVWRDSLAKLHDLLIQPLRHPVHPPEYTARAVGVGLFVGFTPFFGAHIAIVLLFWGLARTINDNMSFNPVLASAWTLISNVATITPLFYVYIQTGRFMLGHWDNIQSFETYLPEFEQSAYANAGWVEILSIQVVGVLAGFGFPLFVGCLPWAVFVSLGGYFASLYFIRRHRRSISQ